MNPKQKKLIALFDLACQARAEGNIQLALLIEARIKYIKERG